MGSVTELFDTSPADTTSPAYMKDELRTNPHEGMMKIIKDTNAVNKTSGIDLTNVAAHTSPTMSDGQRSQMLSIMAGQTANQHPSMNGGTSAASPSPSMPAAATPGMVNPGLSLSPVLPTSIPPPPLQPYQQMDAELNALQQLQQDQANNLDSLHAMFGPLSPAGRIPGFDDNANPDTNYFDDEINQIFLPNERDYGIGLTGGNEGSDFNFNLDGGGDYPPFSAVHLPMDDYGGGGGDPGAGIFEAGRIFETNSASATTPSEAGTEEISRNDMESPERDTKRRRKG